MTRPPLFGACLLFVFAFFESGLSAADNPLQLTLRSRVKAGEKSFRVEQQTVRWEPTKTALIICDMWDDHWCKSAARRVAELAGPMNEVVSVARQRGVFIIHAPSTTTKFYDGTPARLRAQRAAFVKTPLHHVVLARYQERSRFADRRFGHGLRLRREVPDS